jgi:large subunit ribosomal protein L18
MEKRLRNPKRAKQQARQRRVSRKVGHSRRPRLTVYRTARHIYAQLVDAETGRTVAGVSTRSKAVSQGLSSTGNVEAARRVGAAIAELAKEKQIGAVVFNRNGFLYHGRIKALAEAAREAGLQF